MDEHEMEAMARAYTRAVMDEMHRQEELASLDRPKVVDWEPPWWHRLPFLWGPWIHLLEALAIIAIAVRLYVR